MAENSDPFAEIETRILEEAAKWRKGTFTVTREVYEKDESLCHALEQAIWVSVLLFCHIRFAPPLMAYYFFSIKFTVRSREVSLEYRQH